MKSCRARLERRHAAPSQGRVPANPFAHMGAGVAPTAPSRRRATPTWWRRFAQADAMDLPSLGTAMMLTWEMAAARGSTIFTAFEFAHYRPKDHPKRGVYVVHPKNGEAVWIPLYDAAGAALFPELMARMDAMRRESHRRRPVLRARLGATRRTDVRQPWAPNGNVRTITRKTPRNPRRGRPAARDHLHVVPPWRPDRARRRRPDRRPDIRANLAPQERGKVLTGYVKRTEKQIIDGTHKRRAMRAGRAGRGGRGGRSARSVRGGKKMSRSGYSDDYDNEMGADPMARCCGRARSGAKARPGVPQGDAGGSRRLARKETQSRMSLRWAGQVCAPRGCGPGARPRHERGSTRRNLSGVAFVVPHD